MLKLSRRGDYGLLLLTLLAAEEKGQAISLKNIARKKRMPYKYLSQIAPILVEAGILGSKEGAGGGYYLNREPEEISVGEILELLEGPTTPIACMRDGCVCEPHCLQKSVLEKMTLSYKKMMRSYTLADLSKTK